MKRLLSFLALALIVVAVGPARATPDGLHAGFAVRSIVPPPELMGEVYSVVGGKHPTMVLDPIEARATALRQGDAALIIVAVDLLGLFYDDIQVIREQVRAALGAETQVIVASTHTHSSIDTLGIYGPDLVTTGVNDEYQAFVRDQAVAAALAAAAAQQEATMVVGRVEAPEGYNEYDRNRHPGSFDDGVTAIAFSDGDGEPLGTIVNWASHPELIDPDSGSDPGIPAGAVVISSDYVHTLRTTVEPTRGTTVFLNGPIGAVTALAMPIEDPDTGTPFPRRSVAKARHVGEAIGARALDALANGTVVADPSLRFSSQEFDLQVDNQFILALRAAGTLPRQLYLAGMAAPIGRDVRTEMVLVTLGPVEFLTVPGELQPDLYTGGYLPADEKANPDVPEEQAIQPQMTGEFRFVVGLGQDELGYFVSATDYTFPSLWPVYSDGEDRNGVEHYQETLSLGRDTARSLSQIASLLLGTPAEPDYVAYPGGFLGIGGTPMYGGIDGEVRGIWVDTSDSGRFERGEDANVYTSLPSGAAFGFLDSQSRDIGSSPSSAARGLWIDGNGDGVFDPGADSHLFFDTYALGEGQPGF